MSPCQSTNQDSDYNYIYKYTHRFIILSKFQNKKMTSFTIQKKEILLTKIYPI